MIRRFIPTRRFTMWCFTALAVLFSAVYLLTLRSGWQYEKIDLVAQRNVHVGVGRGTIGGYYSKHVYYRIPGPVAGEPSPPPPPLSWGDVGGRFQFSRFDYSFAGMPYNYDGFELFVPLPWLILASAAIAYMARGRFQFSLKFLLLAFTVASLVIAWYAYLGLRLANTF